MNLKTIRCSVPALRLPKKLLLVMKLTFTLLFAAIMTVSAATYAQKVSLRVKDVSLETALKQIKKQTGYDFVCDQKLLDNAAPVSLNLNNASLSQAMEQVLDHQQLDYALDDGVVTIRAKEPSVIEKLKAAFSAIDVTGRVVDENNQGLPGATITLRNNSQVTSTDKDGYFTLRSVQEGDVFTVSVIGYQKKEVSIQKTLPVIKMVVVTNPLDEVKVIAYGQTTQRYSLGDVTTVSAKDIEKQPVTNPLLALQGKVAGLNITQATGLAGSGVVVRIQGQNSISSGNDPFYVVDGVPYTSQLLPSTIFVQGGSGNTAPLPSGTGAPVGSPLDLINSLDIESITVLKDASATSIYGSRAANGAILITTKKGKAGEITGNLNVESGFGQVPNFLDLMNTPQYLLMRNEALKNDGKNAPSSTDYDLNGVWDQSRSTNWQKMLIGGTANYTNINGSVSGGSVNNQFLVSGNYNHQGTVFPGNLGDTKGSLHFSQTMASANKKFHFSLSGSYLVDDNQLITTDLTGIAVKLAPDAPSPTNADGSLNWAPNASGNNTWGNGYNTINPLAYLLKTYTRKNNNLIGNSAISYDVANGLTVSSTFGYTNLQSSETALSPSTSYAPEYRSTYQNSGAFTNSSITSWIIEPQADFKRRIGKGQLDALAGATIQQTKSTQTELTGYGYLSDENLSDIHASSSITPGPSIYSLYKYSAAFARVNYNWDEKYIGEVSGRRDGSSRFGSANQFHDFWSASAGWIFSNESFLKDNPSVLSFGKLRASYGTTGNDQIGNYSFLDLYSVLNTGVPYQGTNGLAPNGLANPYLQWEETRKLQFGADLGFLKDRLIINVNYFINKSSNELITTKVPVTTGFGFLVNNLPATVENTGLELSVTSQNIKKADFTWSTTATLTVPTNKLLSFPGLANSSYAGTLVVGQPITAMKAYHFIGVDPATGVFTFADANGKPTTNPSYSTDRTALVNSAPKLYGGLQNSLSYKSLEFDFLFTFVKQQGPTFKYGQPYPGSVNTNEPVALLSRWQNPGDVSQVQRFNANYSIFTPYSDIITSDGYYTDASYLKLKNASITWTLPARWTNSMKLHNIRVYAQGQNLFTITPYKGFDPETLSYNSLPPLRLIVFGFKLGI